LDASARWSEQKVALSESAHSDAFSGDVWRMLQDSTRESHQVVQQLKRAVQDLQAGELSSQERLDRLDQKIFQEMDTREANIRDIRDLVGGEKLALQEYLAQVQELLSREHTARESHLNLVRDFMSKEVGTWEVQLNDLRGHITREAATRWEQCNSIAASLEQQLAQQKTSIESQMVEVDRFVSEALREHANAILGPSPSGEGQRHNCVGLSERLVAIEEALRHDYGALAADVSKLEKFYSEEKLMNDGSQDALKKLLERESEVRHDCIESLKTILSSNLEAVEVALQERLETLECIVHESITQREGEVVDDQLSAQTLAKEVEDRMSGFYDKVLQQIVGHKEDFLTFQHEVKGQLKLHQDRADSQLTSLRDSLSAIKEQVQRDCEFAIDLVAKEQQARDTRMDSQRDEAAREREGHEKAHRMLHELLTNDRASFRESIAQEREARKQSCSSLDQLLAEKRSEHERIKERLDSCERTTGVLDGLVRAEQSERVAESQRLWQAVDGHTHDIRKSSLEDNLPPVAASLAVPSVPTTRGTSPFRTESVSPRQLNFASPRQAVASLQCPSVAVRHCQAPGGFRGASPAIFPVPIPVAPPRLGTGSSGLVPVAGSPSPWWAEPLSATTVDAASVSPRLRRTQSASGSSTLRCGHPSPRSELLHCGPAKYSSGRSVSRDPSFSRLSPRQLM